MRCKRIICKILTIFLAVIVFSHGFADGQKKILTLRDAITLGLRFNATVRNAELDRVTQKFDLFLQRWNFMPQYDDLKIEKDWNQSRVTGVPGSSQTWSVSSGMNWKSHYGTTVKVTPSGLSGGVSSSQNRFHPSVDIDITQQLMKGFGRAVVDAALESAIVTNETQKLNLKDTLMQQITTTIQNYMSVVEDENSIEVDKESIDRAKTNLFQTQQFILAGNNPRSDEIQAKTQVASAQVQLQQDLSALAIARYQLMQTIGLKPSAQIEVSHALPTRVFHLPPEKDCIDMALKHNVTYQTSVLTMANTARSLMTAKDSARWGLALEENYSRGTGAGGNVGVNGLLNNANYGSTTSLTLTIPIDDMNLKSAVLSAKIAMEEAEISLQQDRQNLIITTESSYNNLHNDQIQVQLDKKQVALDKQNMVNAQRKYQAGITDSLAVTQLSETLSSDQRSLVSARIQYFEDLATFDQSLGHALKTWGITIKNI